MMAYFPNGTAGDMFQARCCAHCIHDADEDKPCMVWGAHLMFSYGAEGPLKDVLDMLIPMQPNGLDAGECAMFVDRQPARCRDTPDMFETKEA